MVVSQRDSIEFVVNESAFVSLKSKQKHVECLFDVTVSASNNNNDAGDLRWVKVNGGEKLRMKAKEYITSLGKPEVVQIISVGSNLSERQSESDWSLAEFILELEKESSASITVLDESKVRVAGSALSVEYVVTSIESNSNPSPTSKEGEEAVIVSQQEQRNPPGNGVLVTDLPFKRARLGSTSTLDENDSAIGEELSDSLEAVESLIGSLQQEDLDEGYIVNETDNNNTTNNMASALKFANHDNDSTALVMSNSSSFLPVETSQDFAEKLGYSKELYALAVRKLGRGADRNALLNELVKLKNSAKELNEERYATEVPKQQELRRRNSCSMINTSPKPLRAIIIDGSNVAMSHGKQKVFSCKGIALAIEWFKRRGHKSIYVVIPTWRKEAPSEQYPMTDQEILRSLDEDGHLIYTPSRTISGKRIVCYDDRYIMKVACDKDGVIVSNDNFRDLQRENPEWKKVVEERLLMYSFVDDMFMPPDDPHGRRGPTIDELLTVGGSGTKSKLCQYGPYCTYGRHCKYAHPERDPDAVLRDSPSNCPRPYSEPVPITPENFCEEFKRVLSMPNLHGNQPQAVGGYPMHAAQLPPALPQRHPRAAPPPPIPPRNNNVLTRGMMASNESPYAPLPVGGVVRGMEHQAPPPVMQTRRQPRLQPRQHPDYDTLPLPIPRAHMPPQAALPHGRYHHYTNIPTAVYINGNGQRRRGGPYDNIPPAGGQVPVYPTHKPGGVCQHSYYRARAPPVDDIDDDEKPALPSRSRHSSEAKPLSSSDIEKLMAYAKKLDEAKKSEHMMPKKKCKDKGKEGGRRPLFNFA